jgi:ATP-dependent Clp protease ATP-binding subunit ClpB
MMETTLLKYYRPELLNRFDGVILFKPLSPENIEEIARLMLAAESKKLEESRGATLTATAAAIKELSVKGYDPALGARPLRRVIQEDVNNALAKFLLTGQVQRGQRVVLDEGGKIRVE